MESISKYLMFGTAIEDDDSNLWVSDALHNGLYRIDSEQRKCELIGFFPDEPYSGHFLYSDVYYRDGELFFIPFSANGICIYNLSTNFFYSIPLYQHTETSYSHFFRCFARKERLFLVPCRENRIIELNMITKEMTFYPLFEETDIHKWLYNDDPFVFKGAGLYENTLIICSASYDYAELIDLDSFSREEVKIPFITHGITNLELNGNIAYLVGRNGCVISWNIDNATFREICPSGMHDVKVFGHGKYSNSWLYKDTLLLTSRNNRKIKEISCVTFECKEKNMSKPEEEKRSVHIPFDCTIVFEWMGSVYLQDAWDGIIYRYQENDEDICRDMWRVEKDTIDCDSFMNELGIQLPLDYKANPDEIPFLIYVESVIEGKAKGRVEYE